MKQDKTRELCSNVVDEELERSERSSEAREEELLRIAKSLVEERGIQDVQAWFGSVTDFARLCYSVGCARAALDPVCEAINRATTSAALPQRRLMLTLLGVLQIDAGNFPASLEALSKALDVCSKLNDPSATASVLINTSTALIDSDLASHAHPVCRAALAQARSVEKPDLRSYLEAAALNNIAFAALHTGSYSDGLIAGRAALRLIGEPCPLNSMALELRANSLRNFGNLLLRVRYFDEAANCVAKAVALSPLPSLGPRGRSSIQNLQGLYDVYTGNFAQGIERLQKASETAQGFPKDVEAILLRSLIEAYEMVHDAEALIACKQRLAKLMQRAGREEILFHFNRGVHRLLPQPKGQREVRQFTGMRPKSLSQRRGHHDSLKFLEDLCVAAELQDDSSGEHPYRVGKLAQLLAAEAGLSPAYCNEIGVAARLHDIGKTGTPSNILRTNGPLDPDAREIMKQHATSGADLLGTLGFAATSMALQIARHHHERWDGSGYPDGLRREGIPLEARITAICETFDAITHDRAYRPRIPAFRALQLIRNHSGSHFDPCLVQSFLALARRLLTEHKCLDRFLAQGAHESSAFLRAKQQLTAQVAYWGRVS